MSSSLPVSAYPLSLPPSAAMRSAPDSAYDPPNSTFFFYAPLVMVAAGLVAWFRPDNSTFMLCTFIGTLVALLCMWDLVILEGPVRFSRVWAMTLLLGYALGAANSWYTIPRGTLTLPEFFIMDSAALARAQGAVLLACATLMMVGELWEKPLFRRDFKLQFDSRVIFFCALGTLVTLAAYAAGKISFMGAVIDSTHELGVFPTLAGWLITPAFALTVAAAVDTRSFANRVMLGVLSVVQLVCIFPFSRRTLLYSLVLALISVRFALRGRSISIPKKLLVMALAGGLFYIGNVAFFYMRVTLWHTKSSQHLTIAQLGRDTIALSQQTQAATVLGRLHENEQTRTFIIGYFSDVLNGSLNHPPAYGLDMMHALNNVVPRAFNPAKTDQRYLVEEQIAADVYGLGANDQANSVLTGGAIDFGMLGVLIYPITIALLARAYVGALSMFVQPWITTVVTLALSLSFFQPENEFGDIFVASRNSLLFAVLLIILAGMPRIHVSLKLSR